MQIFADGIIPPQDAKKPKLAFLYKKLKLEAVVVCELQYLTDTYTRQTNGICEQDNWYLSAAEASRADTQILTSCCGLELI